MSRPVRAAVAALVAGLAIAVGLAISAAAAQPLATEGTIIVEN